MNLINLPFVAKYNDEYYYIQNEDDLDFVKKFDKGCVTIALFLEGFYIGTMNRTVVDLFINTKYFNCYVFIEGRRNLKWLNSTNIIDTYHFNTDKKIILFEKKNA